MNKRSFLYQVAMLIGFLILSSCSRSEMLVEDSSTENSLESIDKPYVILVSLDGFRWDYVEKYNPPNLSEFIKNGVKSESLIPSFPSKTFPNHYTIATGMYPDKHGIIGNTFYSYKKNATYRIGDRQKVEDGDYYEGTPIWVQADKNKMVSASYFFVGSEADVQGIRPTYYHRYDGRIKNEARVAQVVDWLSLPEKKRPHMITMYFSDMDDIGHKYGPNNEEQLKKVLFDLDKNLGKLITDVEASGLPTNIIIVSDHGMTEIPISNYIPTESLKNENLYTTVDNGALLNIHPKDGIHVDTIFRHLQSEENNYKVYKTADTPGLEYTPNNKDWGSIQVIPDYGYYFISTQSIESKKQDTNKLFGVHGYDPAHKDMHGIFYANGPAFKKGYVMASVKNIHIYPLICEILSLDVPNDVDGKLEEMEDVLKSE